jgi:hypothetical protein
VVAAMFSESSAKIQGMFKQPSCRHPIFPHVNTTPPDGPTVPLGGRTLPRKGGEASWEGSCCAREQSRCSWVLRRYWKPPAPGEGARSVGVFIPRALWEVQAAL